MGSTGERAIPRLFRSVTLLGRRFHQARFGGFGKEIWTLTIAAFVYSTGSMAIRFFPIFLSGEMNFSPESIGQILGVYAAGEILGGFFGARLCDRMPPARILAISLAGGGVGILGLLVVNLDYLSILCVLALAGCFGGAFRSTYNLSLAALLPPADRMRGFSLYLIANNLGVTVGGMVGGFLATANWYLVFLADGLASLAAASAVLCFGSSNRMVAVRQDQHLDEPISPWRNTSYLWFLSCLFAINWVHFQMITTYPLYLFDHYKISAYEFGIIQSYQCALIVLSQILFGTVLRELSSRFALVSGCLCLTLGYALLPYGRDFSDVLVFAALRTAGITILFPATLSRAYNFALSGRPGHYIALYDGAFSIASVLVPWAAGIVYGRWSGDVVWHFCAFAGLVAIAGFVRLPAHDPAVGLSPSGRT